MTFNYLYNTPYYPFGMVKSERSYSSGGGYRYGFNGQEKDDEVAGEGNSITALFWQYDSRLGRRWNLDPVVKANMSNLSAFSNNPIIYVDPEGNTDYYNRKGKYVGTDGLDNGQVRVALEKTTAKLVKKATRKNLNISLNENVYKDLIPVLAEKEQKAIDHAYERSEDDNKEHGFVVFIDAEINIEEAQVGSSDDIDLWPAREAANTKGTILYDAHVHTDEYSFVNGRLRSNDPEPSAANNKGPGDVIIRRNSEIKYPNGFIQPSMILGYESYGFIDPATQEIRVSQFKTIGYYDKGGLRTQIGYKELKKISNKVNNDQTKRHSK